MSQEYPSRPLKNTRHERFAHARVEGETIERAYTAAGYRLHKQNAMRLSARADVAQRIAWLQPQAAERAVETVQDVVRRLDRAYVLAITERECAAAVSAAMGIAKVLGLIVDRHENRAMGDLIVEIVKFSDDARGECAAHAGSSNGHH